MPLTFPVARPVVFPLHPIVDGRCGCGFSGCTRIGKHPATLWRDLAFGAPVERPAPGAGIGMRTGVHPRGSDVVVVDLDGEDAVAKWEELGGSEETFTVQTGRDGVGLQLYFRPDPSVLARNTRGLLWHNGKPKDEGAQGIDTRGEGGFVVLPGSPHESGRTYEVLVDAPIAPMPAWLVEWFRARPVREDEAQAYAGDVTGDERDRRLRIYREYLATAPPCIEGRGGDEQLWRVVQKGAYDLALPAADVLAAIEEVYDPRCMPPWGDELEERVLHKVDDAKSTSTRAAAPPLPADLEHLAKAVPPGLGLDAIVREARRVEEAEQPSPAPAPSDPPLPLDAPQPRTLLPEEQALNVCWGGWDEPLEPPQFLVDGLIPVATVGIFVAKGSSLKTWTALSIGADVANGEPWLGSFMTRKSPVLIIDFESGRWQLRQRMRLLQKTKCPDLAHANFPAARIDTHEFWRDLAHVVLARKIGLVIIDSFAAGASGVDENDAAAAMPLHYASEFSEKLQCAVLFIHHAKKGDGGDERDVARGSGAIYAGCDWMYMFTPANEDRTKMVVHCNKPWGELPKDFRVALTVDGLVLDSGEEEAYRSEEIESLIKATLAAGPAGSRQLLHKRMKKQNGTCSAEIDALVTRREIVFIEGQGYTLDSPTLRRDRIRAATHMPGTSTPGKLAAVATVDESEVLELIRDGLLYRSGAGYQMAGSFASFDL